MARFFVSCQPHLEKELLNELESFWHLLIDLDGLPTRSRPELVYEDIGGIEIECDIHLGLQINLFTKLANRVLWRIHKFEARFFDQYEKELKKFDLKKYFGEQKFNVQIESAKSRLFHESNLLETTQKVFKNALSKSDDQAPSLYIRIFKDTVNLSLDTSGNHLHKRGYRVQQGEAPIRETLAAKMYNFLLNASLQNLTTYSPQNPKTLLLDPFCGSGTLLFEAASFFTPNLVTPFAFEKISAIPALLKSPTWKKNYKIESVMHNCFMGIELDPKTYAKLEANLQEFLKIFPSAADKFYFAQGDSAQVNLSALSDYDNIVLIANPPYGERLKNTDAVKTLVSLERLANLSACVVVHPVDWKIHFSKLKLKHSEPFNNQGLELRLSLFSY